MIHRVLSGDPQMKVFHVNTKMLFAFFHCADIYTEGAKTMAGNPIGSSARIKAVASNCTSGPCVLHCHILTGKKPVSLKDILNEGVKKLLILLNLDL